MNICVTKLVWTKSKGEAWEHITNEKAVLVKSKPEAEILQAIV